MTAKNYKKLTEDFCFTANSKIDGNKFRHPLFKKMTQEIIEEYPFFNGYSPSQIIWHIANDVYEEVCCKGKNRKSFNSFTKGYRKTCGDRKCICYEEIHLKRGQSFSELYKTGIIAQKRLASTGYISPFSNPEIRKKAQEKNANKSVEEKRAIANKVKNTMLERHGGYTWQSEKLSKKCTDTMIKRYGTALSTQSKEIIQKRKESNLKKYGCEEVFQNEQVRETYKENFIAKYGVDNPSKVKEIKEKALITFKNKSIEEKKEILRQREQTTLERFGVRNVLMLKKHQEKSKQVLIDRMQREGKDFFKGKTYKESGISKPHELLVNFLKEAEVEFSYNNRTEIGPMELDIFIPSLNFAIEIHGLYWHTESKGKTVDSHVKKLNRCLDKDITLFQFWDKEVIDNTNIVLSMIKNKLGYSNKIMARKCHLTSLTSKQAKEFFSVNHLQGHVNASIYLGLLYEDELVSAISISKSRFNKKGSDKWEIVRYANKLGYSVIGGFSKLIKNSGLTGTIISYANRMYSTGNLYKQAGFEFIRHTPPCYFYTKDHVNLEHRVKYQKHKLPLLLENFNANLSETANMKNNGFDRVWDCGTSVYELSL